METGQAAERHDQTNPVPIALHADAMHSWAEAVVTLWPGLSKRAHKTRGAAH